MKKIFLTIITIFCICGFLFTAKVFALNNWDEGYQVSSGTTKNIYAKGTSECHKITNNSGYTFFVPTKYVIDWNAFSAYTPSGVTISSCMAATLTWTVTGATSCSATGDWSGSRAISGGTEETGALSASKTYCLECWNGAGSSGKKCVTANN